MCPSYAMIPTSRKPGVRATARARSATWAAECRGSGGRRRGRGPEEFERGVQLQADTHDFGAALACLVDQTQLRGVVHHDGDGGGELGVARQLGEGLAVRRRVGEQDVVEPGAGEPQGLGERERHDAREAVPGQHAFEQGTAAYGLAGDADRLAAGPADQVVGVGVESLQVHDRDRGVELSGGPIVAGPVCGAGSHDRSLPDAITAG
ncbi:hypothetical protein SAV31267_022290 [Streptomyces avermitilis]|uniref:Uncharacterized protein n=1 Tax=Streptomyces avermitilis TaxID=33903 RepID=A0A4D4MM26_STRAX|nr:hypothetical protein SAV31267_022290 [Streptomyces avermitilis]